MRRVAALTLLAALALAGAAACAPVRRVPEPVGVPEQTTEVSLFYSTGRTLLEEKRLVDSTRVYEATLEELLLASPESNPDVAIVQPVTGARSVTLADGVLTVDWEASVLEFEADPDEKALALASILRTFGQFPEVDKVRFTVEGEASGQAGGRDIEAFWGDVSLKVQPFDALRGAGDASAEPTAGAARP